MSDANVCRRDYPALESFCRGYLHEDALAEYGSLAGAARAFRADASADEARALIRDWRTLRARVGPSDAALAGALRGLGAAVVPLSAKDIESFHRALARRVIR